MKLIQILVIMKLIQILIIMILIQILYMKKKTIKK